MHAQVGNNSIILYYGVNAHLLLVMSSAEIRGNIPCTIGEIRHQRQRNEHYLLQITGMYVDMLAKTCAKT